MQSIKAGLVLLSLFVNTLLMGATNGLVINSVNIEKTNLIKIRLKTGQSLIGNRKIIKENNNANSKDTKIVYEFLGLLLHLTIFKLTTSCKITIFSFH